jgi:hypothetical protein
MPTVAPIGRADGGQQRSQVPWVVALRASSIRGR